MPTDETEPTEVQRLFQAEEWGPLWEALTRHDREQRAGKLPTGVGGRRAKLPLPGRLPAAERPRPEIRRHIGEISPDLSACFRALVSGDAPWPLFLFGPVGTGKTCAALVLCDYARGVYHSAESLADEVMAGRTDLWEDVRGADLGVVDEIGLRTKVPDLHYTTLKRYWEEREAKAQRTVYVSNVAPDMIRTLYDDRLASRLLCGTWFEALGDDRRLVK